MQTHRPRIGITTSLNEHEQRLELTYVDAVVRAGGWPVIVPMVEDVELLQVLVHTLDGLIISGGPAVTIGLVGTVPQDLAPNAARRVETDCQVLTPFLDDDRPVLGICYGMQLMNALRGGTIYGDVQAERPGTLPHSPTRGGQTHAVALMPGSCLQRIIGASEVEVNTRHLQAIATPGDGFWVNAMGPDGVIEGIEDKAGRLLGVQFHPERMAPQMDALFRYLVDRAREAAANRPSA